MTSTSKRSKSLNTKTGSSKRSSRRVSSRGRSRRSSSSSFLGISRLPSWAPIALAVAGACGLVYGLMQITAVSDFVDPMISDVGEFFGLSDDEGIDSRNLTHDRTYSGVGS